MLGGPCTIRAMLNKFEQVWRFLYGEGREQGSGSMYGEGRGRGQDPLWGPAPC